MSTVEPLDYAVFAIYLALMAGVGVCFGWFVKDMAGYFKGGSVIPWPVAGISNYMSMFSTFVFVAYAGIAYEHGLVALTVIWCSVPPCILAATVFAKRWRRAELTTPILFVLPPLAARVVLPNLPDHEMAYVAISAKLLPSGLLGMMLAAMFSATMSSLNSEYNVMAGVLTNDVYKRLLAPDASPGHLLWIGRLVTVLIGLGITVGAMGIGGMQGAFEANKLFTSILAIPLAVPLLFGLLLRRPNSFSLVLAVVGGASFAVVVNFWDAWRDWLATVSGLDVFKTLEAPSWEVGTLATIAVSVLLFCIGGWLINISASRIQAVERFFDKLHTPIDAADIPSVGSSVRTGLALLFGGSFVTVGLLYVGVSLFGINEFSGKVGAAAGLACVFGGGVTCLLTLHQKRKEDSPS